MIMRGPPVTDINGSVYQFGSKCVEFQAHPIECPKDTKGGKAIPVVETITFADIS
jgi:hypothetical protein